MSVVSWPDHLLSLTEWDALPEDLTHHYELVEGNLFVTPRPAPPHQLALSRIGYWLNEQLPDHLIAYDECEVLISGSWPATVRVPDVLVTHTGLVEEQRLRRFSADQVVLAVEIVSPGSMRTDRLTKLLEYADAGIPDYWIVDLDDPVRLTTYQLVNGEYKQIVDGTGAVELASPAPFRVDLDALVRRRV